MEDIKTLCYDSGNDKHYAKAWISRMYLLLDEADNYLVTGFFSSNKLHINRLLSGRFKDENTKIIRVILNKTHNNTGIFWRDITRALSKVYRQILPQIERIGFPLSTPAYEMYTKVIQTHMIGREKFYIVFDNVDVIENENVLSFMFRLAEEVFSDVKIFMIFSKPPQKDFSEKVIQGVFYPITQEDINFTLEETSSCFENVLCGLAREDIEMFQRQYNGNPMSVRMALDYTEMYGKLWEMKNVSQSYILETMIWNVLDDETKQICLKLYYLKSFDCEMWCKIFEKTEQDFHEFLNKVRYCCEVFRTETFVFDCAFYEFLEWKLESAQDLDTECCNFAAHCFEQCDNLSESALLYERCMDYEKLMWISVEMFGKGRDYYESVYDIAKKIPKAKADENLQFCLVKTALELVLGDTNEAVQSIELLLLQYKDNASPDSGYLLGEMYTLAGIVGYMTSNSTLYSYFTVASDLLPDGTVIFRDFMSCVDVVPYSFRRFFSDKEVSDEFHIMLRNMCPVMTKVLGGDAAGLGMLLNAQRLYLQNKHDEAKTYINICKPMAETHKQYAIIQEANFLLVQIFMRQGNGSKAFALLKVMRKYAESLYYPRLNQRLSLMESIYYLYIGEANKVPIWIKKADFKFDIDLGDMQWFMYNVHGEYLYKIQRFYELEIFLAQLRQILISKNNSSVESRIRFLIMASLTLMKDTKLETAKSFFEKACEISRKNGIIMPFIEKGSEMLKLIAHLEKDKHHKISKEWLEDIYKFTKEYDEMENNSMKLKKIYGLTPKELEVLTFISKGYTNAQIASKVFTTVPTVKWYAGQIFSKLGVANRTEAARKAISTGLVEKHT